VLLGRFLRLFAAGRSCWTVIVTPLRRPPRSCGRALRRSTGADGCGRR